VIWANTFNRFDPASPFGGYKESGYGREGGRHGLAAYLKPASSASASAKAASAVTASAPSTPAVAPKAKTAKKASK
jgi:acyl-CoA reductase-like NAD-dependent aldehyde dehydrogenase